MMKTFALALALVAAAVAGPALADDVLQHRIKERIALADGGELYVFKDGKMAKADAYGRPVTLQQGAVLTAQDGRKIRAVGNETARLASMKAEGHGG